VGPIALDPVFYLSEDKIHKNGLGTDPATEQPSVDYGEKNDEYNKCYQKNSEEIKILRPENASEENELPVKNVEQYELLAGNMNERCEEKKE
jgi:hypothetical protein